MSASNQSSYMPFLRNEFSKIFENFFYDDVIYKDDYYLWPNDKFKI